MRSRIIYFALTVIFLFGLYGSSFGQVPVVKWSKEYPSKQEVNASYSAKQIVETSDGFVICGIRHVQEGTNPSTNNVFVLKIDKAGTIIWMNNYDIENPVEGFESNEYANAMVQNDQGNFFLVGYQSLPSITIPAPDGIGFRYYPAGRAMVIEIMADGTLGRIIPTDNDLEFAEAKSIVKTINNTYVITGSGTKYIGDILNLVGESRILLGEFTGAEDDTVHYKGFKLYLGSPPPPGNGIWATSIVETPTKLPYLVAGNFLNMAMGTKDDIFLMNTDDEGLYEWEMRFGGDESEFLTDVVIIGDYCYLVGNTKVLRGEEPYSHLDNQVYVAKIEPFGIVREKWQKTFVVEGTHSATAAFKSQDGNLMVLGYTYARDYSLVMFLMKIDAESGDQIWREDYEKNSSFGDAIQTSDFDYLLSGKYSYSGVPSKQLLLMYMGNSQGTATVVIPHWAIGLGLVNTSDNIDVVTATDLTDNLYGVSVTINELLHPDVSNLEIFLEHGGISVKLVARNTASGINFINTNFSDASENPIASGLAPYTGSFMPAESLRAFNGTDPKGDWTLRIIDYSTKGEKSATGTLNGWTLKLLADAGSGTGIHSAAGNEDMMLYPCYPNPAQEETRIDFNILSNDEVNISVYNQAGQMVAKLIDEVLTPGFYSMVWNLHDVSPGVYFIRLETNGISTSRKVVVFK